MPRAQTRPARASRRERLMEEKLHLQILELRQRLYGDLPKPKSSEPKDPEISKIGAETAEFIRERKRYEALIELAEEREDMEEARESYERISRGDSTANEELGITLAIPQAQKDYLAEHAKHQENKRLRDLEHDRKKRDAEEEGLEPESMATVIEWF